ncbi:hypothetical protein FB645_003736 [Coemansia sp. IMI 203386]|nr:hypothetical protein FB645_003736 [Coemansia sp. IMI 203386]
MYSEDTVVYACVGGLSVTAIALAAFAIWHRRRAHAKEAIGSADEEGSVVAVAGCEDNANNVSAAESQPLLSESAIRTYYATNANEFARSYIGRTQPCSFVTPQSLGQDAGTVPFGEHVLTIVPTVSSDSSDSGIESCAGEADASLLEHHLNESYAGAVASVFTAVTPSESGSIEQAEGAAGSAPSIQSAEDSKQPDSLIDDGSIGWAEETQADQPGDSSQPIDDSVNNSSEAASRTVAEDVAVDLAIYGHDQGSAEAKAQAKAEQAVEQTVEDSAEDSIEETADEPVEESADAAVEELAQNEAKESAEESCDEPVEELANDSANPSTEDSAQVLPEDPADQPIAESGNNPVEESAPSAHILAESTSVYSSVSAMVAVDAEDRVSDIEPQSSASNVPASTSTTVTTTPATALVEDTPPGLVANNLDISLPEASSRPRSSTLNAQAKVFVPGRKQSMLSVDAAATSAVRRSKSDESASRMDASSSDATREASQQRLESFAITRNRSRNHGSVSSSQSDQSNASERTAQPECSASNVNDCDNDGGESSNCGDSNNGDDSSNGGDSGALDPKQLANNSIMAKRRCRFWPSCSNRNCKYRHPSQTCNAYPNCTFGNNCIYIHPSDAQKINSVISRMHGDGTRRPKRKHNDIIRLNNLSGYVNN